MWSSVRHFYWDPIMCHLVHNEWVNAFFGFWLNIMRLSPESSGLWPSDPAKLQNNACIQALVMWELLFNIHNKLQLGLKILKCKKHTGCQRFSHQKTKLKALQFNGLANQSGGFLHLYTQDLYCESSKIQIETPNSHHALDVKYIDRHEETTLHTCQKV